MVDGASIATPGWSQIGELPPFDPSISRAYTDAQLDFLTEDIVTFRSDDGRSVIDVGWYPHRDPNGAFRGVLVRDDDWENPEDYFVHKSVAAVRSWLDFRISQACSLSGARPPPNGGGASARRERTRVKKRPARAPASSEDRWNHATDSPEERPRLSYAGLGA